MPSARLNHYTVHFHNSEEFHGLKQEIFSKHNYYFETSNPSPVIIDAGAHIGLSTLYFKKTYPGAKIIAIEPLPQNLEMLEKNIWENQLNDVEVFPVALATQTGEATLFADSSKHQWWSTSSFKDGAWNGQQESSPLTVHTRPLDYFLTQPIDFLKMDIEGAEQEVLMAAAEKLKIIKHMVIEFHTTGHNKLHLLIEFLEKLGFKIELTQDGKSIHNQRTRGLIYIEAKNSNLET